MGGGSLNGPNQRLSHVPSTSHWRTILCTPKGDRAPLLGFCPSHRGVGSFHRAAAIGPRTVERGRHPPEPERRLKPWPRAYRVWELRALQWDILWALVGISTRTPYCSRCVCVSITHSTHVLRGPERVRVVLNSSSIVRARAARCVEQQQLANLCAPTGARVALCENLCALCTVYLC